MEDISSNSLCNYQTAEVPQTFFYLLQPERLKCSFELLLLIFKTDFSFCDLLTTPLFLFYPLPCIVLQVDGFIPTGSQWDH